MANRIIRDWTSSETVDILSPGAEIFFTRLIMKADDFGCYYGNPKLLKSHLFPLKDYKDSEVLTWRNECVKAGVIKLYTSGEKEYIHIPNFGQRLRSMSSKFPRPGDDSSHTCDINQQTIDSTPPTIVSDTRPEVEGEGEEETEVEGESEPKAQSANSRAEFSKPDRITKGKEKQNAISRGAGRARNNCADVPLEKQDVVNAIFSDDRYISDLQIAHSGKDLRQAFDECWIYHSQKPSPPEHLWQWKQKLNTWLTIKKRDNGNRTTPRTSQQISAQVGGTDYDSQRW